MRAEIVLPELGAAPVSLSVWFADVGDRVFEGDRLVERLAWPRDLLTPGQVLGVVEAEEGEAP